MAQEPPDTTALDPSLPDSIYFSATYDRIWNDYLYVKPDTVHSHRLLHAAQPHQQREGP